MIATMTDLIENFERGKLEQFHHSDHVRMAFEYLCHYPALEALGRFSDALRRFAAAQGKPHLYHETITWAYVLIIRQRMAQSANQEWDEFAQNNPDLFVWLKPVSPGCTIASWTRYCKESRCHKITFLFLFSSR